MQTRSHRGFNIHVHAEPCGRDQCLVMTDITCGGLVWGCSSRTRLKGDCSATEEVEMDAAMAMIETWGGRSSSPEAPGADRPPARGAARTVGGEGRHA